MVKDIAKLQNLGKYIILQFEKNVKVTEYLSYFCVLVKRMTVYIFILCLQKEENKKRKINKY